MAANNDIAKMKQSILGISTASLAAISGINPNRLSIYLSGTRQLPIHDLLRLEETFTDLEKLVQVSAPWPLSFKSTQTIKDLLKRMKNGEFD